MDCAPLTTQACGRTHQGLNATKRFAWYSLAIFPGYTPDTTCGEEAEGSAS